MIASTQAREYLQAQNAKKSAEIAELQQFVSHDREFVSSLATHIIDIQDQQLRHFEGSYDEYLATQDV
jgi:hypothetical protein